YILRSQHRRPKLVFELRIMQPILRFLQLLCENHNPEFQNYLRLQTKHKTNYNLVCETLKFLDSICGSQTGLLGLLGNYINEDNVDLINQALITLTEYCQGPCRDNQDSIVNHESNGIDIIIAIVLNDITPLNQKNYDLVLELKDNASKLLLAVMESRDDSTNAERILRNITPVSQLLDVGCQIYARGKEQDTEPKEDTNDEIIHDEESNDDTSNVAKTVGHNMYILTYQLARHNRELEMLMKQRTLDDEALSYYHKHTAEIEIIRQDRSIEPIVFPVPQLCEFLTNEKKQKVFLTCEQDEQDTLWNVIQCVVRNAKSVILTAVFAVIIIYLFAICGYLFIQDDFLMEVNIKAMSIDNQILNVTSNNKTNLLTTIIPAANDNEYCTKDNCTNDKTTGHMSPVSQTSNVLSEEGADNELLERACDTLFMCIVTTLNKGLRNGGGIGDVLRQPSSREPLYFFRVIYDMMFFFIVIIITLNLIFGVIIDNFADLRTEKQRNDEILRNTCFICALDRKSFDNKHVTFEDHIRKVHNMWNYVYFMVLIHVKDPTEYTGPESYVHEMIEQRNLDWFPRMRTSSLDTQEDKNKEDQDNRILKIQMENANDAIKTLTMELNELQKLVTESRTQKHRMNFLPNAPLPTS
ncbi:unnamed protein product, partial [Rotaria socialis]